MQKKIIFKKFACIFYAKILGETNFQPREFPRSGSNGKDGGEKERKREILQARGGPGSRDRMLAVKRRKNAQIQFFFVKE